MIVSHWGIFPGWLRPKGLRGWLRDRIIDVGELAPNDFEFEPVDWETFLVAVEMVEAAELDYAFEEARELRRFGRKLH